MKHTILSLISAILMAVVIPGGLAAQDVAPLDTTSSRNLVDQVKQSFELHGYAMVDWIYNDRTSPSNEFSINKFILFAQTRFGDRWTAFAMGDFYKMSLHELWVNYRHNDALQVMVGEFKTPFTIESPIAPPQLEMITLTSLATNYMICGSSPLMMPGGAGRDMGVSLHGTLAGGRLGYDCAVMSGAGRNKPDDNSAKDLAARVNVWPVPELMLSASAIVGRGHLDVHLDPMGNYVSDAVPTMTGLSASGNFDRYRYAAGAELKTPRFTARGEYMWGRDANLHSDGGYVTIAARNIVKRGFDVVASVDYLNAHTGVTDRYQAGVQYWFYKMCRIQAACSVTREHHVTTSAFLSQIQVAF